MYMLRRCVFSAAQLSYIVIAGFPHTHRKHQHAHANGKLTTYKNVLHHTISHAIHITYIQHYKHTTHSDHLFNWATRTKEQHNPPKRHKNGWLLLSADCCWLRRCDDNDCLRNTD